MKGFKKGMQDEDDKNKPAPRLPDANRTDEALLTLLLGLALSGAASLAAIASARWRSGVVVAGSSTAMSASLPGVRAAVIT